MSEFIVFSDDWGEHPSSSQHLFRHIAAKHRVIWVNTLGMRRPSLSGTDFRKAMRKISRMVSGGAPSGIYADCLRRGITVCQPAMLPFSRCETIRAFNKWSVRRKVQSLLKFGSSERPIVVATVPNAGDYLKLMRTFKVVYYCVDDFTLWPGLESDLVREMEGELIKRADLLVAASDVLRERLAPSGKPIRVLTHGVDIDLFASRSESEHPTLRNIPKPRAGFFGLIDGRVDTRLLAAIAMRMPDLSFVLAGPLDGSCNLVHQQNVYYVGPIKYENLPALVAGLDVLMIPYKTGGLGDALSPLKLKEYLATGVPVVSAPIAEARRWGACLSLAQGVDEWEQKLTLAMEQKVLGPRGGMRGALESESWKKKADEFLEFCGAQTVGGIS